MINALSFAPAQLHEVLGTNYANLSVHLDAQIVSATRLRRKVNGWLAMDVGDRMLAGEPELIIYERLYWRVLLDWTSLTIGKVEARIAEIFVDAIIGEIVDPLNKIVEIE